MNENSIFFAVDKIEDKYIEEAAESAMEENSVQPLFVTPAPKKTKKPIFAIASIAACFVLIFGVGIAVSRNSGIEITQPPFNIEVTTTAAATTTPAEVTTSAEATTTTAATTPAETTTTEAATTPAEPTPPNNWHNEGYIIPENWLPIMKNDEAFENLDSLFNEPQAGKNISEIIQNLVNRNIVAIDIFYGWGPSFTEEYKVEEPNFGVVNPHTGKTNLYAIKSDYFSSLEEIENIMNKTYTADLAHERLYGQDGDRQIFIERDNKLFVDYNCMYIWSALPFEDDSYIEIITDDEEECFFNYHFILWDPFDYENNETEEWYPHHYIVTLRAVKENGEWRLCSFVFNNPNVDYAHDSLDFISIIDKIIRNAKTVEEITTKIKNLGKGHGHVINAVNVYKNSTDLQNVPIEKGAIEYGMYVRVDYDGEYWLEQAII